MIWLAIWLQCVSGVPDLAIPLPDMAACEAVRAAIYRTVALIETSPSTRCLPPGAPELRGEGDAAQTCEYMMDH